MDVSHRHLLIHPLVWNQEEERDMRALFLRDFVADAWIGIYHQERGRTQKLRFDLLVYLTGPYDWRDEIGDVLDYDHLRQGILGILAAGHINLLETLAERVVAMCFAHPQAAAVHLQITKLEAHGDCLVGYETRRKR
jgi:dihydroneopterin aldolase